jgi:hypothetical protein
MSLTWRLSSQHCKAAALSRLLRVDLNEKKDQTTIQTGSTSEHQNCARF